ncbi:hypothetical protein GCM10020254_23360 [Streptomyces goshikiensis]
MLGTRVGVSDVSLFVVGEELEHRNADLVPRPGGPVPVEELLHEVRGGQNDHFVGARLLDDGLESVEGMLLDDLPDGRGALLAQGGQGVLQGLLSGAAGGLALRFVALVEGLGQFAERYVVDGAQQSVPGRPGAA